MIHRLALTIAAAALVGAGPAFAQAPAAAPPPAPPPAQVAPPPAAPPAPAPAKESKEEKRAKQEKAEKHAKHEKAKGHGTPQTHHCVKDGKVAPDLTNKKCVAAGGVWQRDAEAPVAPPPVAAPKPTP